MNQLSAYEAKKAASVADRRELKQEELLIEVSEQISAAMTRAKMKRSELAATLGRSRSYVTQVLAGDKNLTLRTLSDFADALGCEISLEVRPAFALSVDAAEPSSVGFTHSLDWLFNEDVLTENAVASVAAADTQLALAA
jgi:transcriptional regulator with XRE-family HTH domain